MIRKEQITMKVEMAEGFRKNRDLICPVTFVDEELKKTEELNSLFTLPYDLATMTVAISSSEAAHVKENFNESNIEEYKNFAVDINRLNSNMYSEGIFQYLLMNLRDFAYSFVFSTIEEITNGKCHSVRFEEISSLIEAELSNYRICVSAHRDMTAVYYYQLANIMYVQIVSYIDKQIGKFAGWHQHYHEPIRDEEEIYDDRYYRHPMEDLLEKVYGKDHGMKLSNMTDQFRYTFISSILREMMEQKLPTLYNGLISIFGVAASMAYIEHNPRCIEQLNEISGAGKAVCLPEKEMVPCMIPSCYM